MFFNIALGMVVLAGCGVALLSAARILGDIGVPLCVPLLMLTGAGCVALAGFRTLSPAIRR